MCLLGVFVEIDQLGVRHMRLILCFSFQVSPSTKSSYPEWRRRRSRRNIQYLLQRQSTQVVVVIIGVVCRRLPHIPATCVDYMMVNLAFILKLMHEDPVWLLLSHLVLFTLCFPAFDLESLSFLLLLLLRFEYPEMGFCFVYHQPLDVELVAQSIGNSYRSNDLVRLMSLSSQCYGLQEPQMVFLDWTSSFRS